MNDETGNRIFELLDVIAVEVAAGRNDIRNLDAKVTGLDANVTGLETKIDRMDRRLARVETRVEGVETELRAFRHGFEGRISPLER